MALHPIKALDHVIDEYADYLRTEFRAKDPELREALERELDAPGFLAQEPFYQAHRPFKSGRRWRDLPIEPPLAKVMENRTSSDRAYLHQSDAVTELLKPDARPVVVTTGTGSGKTEAFLLPVIQNAWEDAAKFNKPDLTAILVYPMNALANDQQHGQQHRAAGAAVAGPSCPCPAGLEGGPGGRRTGPTVPAAGARGGVGHNQVDGRGRPVRRSQPRPDLSTMGRWPSGPLITSTTPAVKRPAIGA